MAITTEQFAESLYKDYVLRCNNTVRYGKCTFPEWTDIDDEIKQVWFLKAKKVLCENLD